MTDFKFCYNYIGGASKPADVFTPGDNPTYDATILLSSAPVNITSGQGNIGTTGHHIRSNTSHTVEKELYNLLYGSAAVECEPKYSIPGPKYTIPGAGVGSYDCLDDSVTNCQDQPHYVNGSVSAQQAVYEIPPQ